MENATATFSLWLMGGVDGYRGCGTHEHVYFIGCFATLGRNHMAAPFIEAYIHPYYCIHNKKLNVSYSPYSLKNVDIFSIFSKQALFGDQFSEFWSFEVWPWVVAIARISQLV